MDPVTALAVAGGVSGLASGAAKIAGGFSEASAMKAKAKAAEMDARMAGLRAVQVAGTRQEEINDVLGQINSLRSGRGVALDSATGRAIAKDRKAKGNELKNSDVLGELQTKDSLLARSRNLKAGARVAPILGVINGFGDFVEGGKSFASAGQ